jgi:hypothetical protein
MSKGIHNNSRAAVERKFKQEIWVAAVAGVVALACLIAGASVVKSSSAGGGVLLVIAAIINAVIGYWKATKRSRWTRILRETPLTVW